MKWLDVIAFILVVIMVIDIALLKYGGSNIPLNTSYMTYTFIRVSAITQIVIVTYMFIYTTARLIYAKQKKAKPSIDTSVKYYRGHPIIGADLGSTAI